MSKDVNIVLCSGRLGKDVDIRRTPRGISVCTFTLASTRSVNTSNGDPQREETTWIPFVAWDKVAELAGRFLRKGFHVTLQGRLTNNEWTDNNTGEKRSRLEVTIEQIYFTPGQWQPNDTVDVSRDDNDNDNRPSTANHKGNTHSNANAHAHADATLNPHPDPDLAQTLTRNIETTPLAAKPLASTNGQHNTKSKDKDKDTGAPSMELSQPHPSLKKGTGPLGQAAPTTTTTPHPITKKSYTSANAV